MNLPSDQRDGHFFSESLTIGTTGYIRLVKKMKWDKKIVDKHAKKEKPALDAPALGIAKKFKPEILFKNIRTNTLGSADYETRRLTQVALLEAEYRKAEALTLIRRASFI